MGLKFKRFKAKLSWKKEQKVAEVVCLRYRPLSEFTEALTVNNFNSLEVNENVAQQEERPNSVVKRNAPIHTSNESNQKNIKTPSDANRKNITPLLQPKSILKKNNNSPDLEDIRTASVILATEDYDEAVPLNKNFNSVPAQIQGKHVENLNDKIVNWRDTVEFINFKGELESDFKPDISDRSKITAPNQNQLYGEEETIEAHIYVNGVKYSNEAASIFFDSELPRKVEKISAV